MQIAIQLCCKINNFNLQKHFKAVSLGKSLQVRFIGISDMCQQSIS